MAQGVVIQVQRQIGWISVEMSIALLGGCFLGVMSQLAFYLPFTPIPVTLQTLALFLLAGLLGSRRAVSSTVAYLVQASLGLPVLAGGIANPFWMFDVKAGFLVSFVAAAYLIGKMLEKKTNPSFFYLLFTLSLAQMVVYFIGAGYLTFFVGVEKAIIFGVLPFLSGSVLKILCAALVLKGRAITQ